VNRTGQWASARCGGLARRASTAALAAVSAVLASGCGSTATPSTAPVPAATTPALSLSTSLQTGTAAWAVLEMGGSAADFDNFWQVLTRPADGTQWKLVTPAGTADNGGLVLASGGQSLITAFRPSQDLTFTPLSATSDDGQQWLSTGPLDASLASTPDALAEGQHGQLVALLGNGDVTQATPGYTSWHALTSLRALRATAAGRRCGLVRLTAVTFTSAGVPLAGGDCRQAGTTGLFTDSNGNWTAGGLALPASLAGQHVSVLRLQQNGTSTGVLLEAGSGRTASVLAGWLPESGTWDVSPPLRLAGASVAAASFAAAGTACVILGARRGEIVAASAAGWQPLPALPPGTATIVCARAGALDALAVRRGTLTIWQLAARSARWIARQTIKVPIQYGSSG
jgi:hypothetical protein